MFLINNPLAIAGGFFFVFKGMFLKIFVNLNKV